MAIVVFFALKEEREFTKTENEDIVCTGSGRIRVTEMASCGFSCRGHESLVRRPNSDSGRKNPRLEETVIELEVDRPHSTEQSYLHNKSNFPEA